MRISGTFLTSKVGQRIALLLLLVAAIPATLMTVLSNQKLSEIITNYEHQSLVEKSRNHALTVFSNLIFARDQFEHGVTSHEHIKDLNDLSIEFALKNVDIFNSLTEVSLNGTVRHGNQNKPVPQTALQRLDTLPLNAINLKSWSNKDQSVSVNFIFRQTSNSSVYIAEINPAFLWGETSDYPSDLSICAYQLDSKAKTKLFCSSEYSKDNQVKPSPLNNAAWELFLAGEFHDKSWLFETKRLSPISPNTPQRAHW